jgi:hyperosmotically inducible periplasmic protein
MVPATFSASPLFQEAAAPDNTKANKEGSAKMATADKANNDVSDREMMRHIRQDIVKDKTLSTYAHNVKIIAQRGKVTLRGPVHSEEEKRAIEKHARKYVGEGQIVNEMIVK